MDNSFEDIKNAVILIADKSNFNLVNIPKILNENGYRHILLFNNCKAVLAAIATNSPDLVIIGEELTDCSGLEMCNQIRNYNANSTLRILMHNSYNSSAQRRDAFQAGVNDLIIHPIETAELLTRIESQLNQSLLYQALIKSNSRIAKELYEAKTMLESLLPKPSFLKKLSENHNISLAFHYQPSYELGGDFFDVIDTKKDKIIIYIWDFAGHGISAALNTCRLHGMVSKEYDKGIMEEPGPFLTEINQALYNVLPRQHYATIFYGVIDFKNQTMEYACAASTPPILIDLNGKKGVTINPSGIPLGAKNGAIYHTQTMSISGYDMLLLYSDALIETPKVTNGKFLTNGEIIDYLLRTINTNHAIKASHIQDLILKLFHQECLGKIFDDLTLLTLKFPKRS